MLDDRRIAARQRILQLLHESIRRSTTLKYLLEAERRAVEAMDTEALQAALGDKRDCIDSLRLLDNQRSAQCQEAGFPAGPAQMDQMCDWCDDQSVIRQRWTELLDVATGCRQLNDTIGAIIHARRSQVTKGLAVLCGTDTRHGTYGRNAGTLSGPTPRNLVKA